MTTAEQIANSNRNFKYKITRAHNLSVARKMERTGMIYLFEDHSALVARVTEDIEVY